VWQEGVEPVPGYRLVKILGRGGFGEVWKAIGPGEIAVALKYLALDSAGAAVEARALSLMKEIRHPHLMPLFGAWENGGYLIMAMELAEGSLLDRYENFRRQGQTGIPREQLLEWMLEAAKGLDYLNEPHPGGGTEWSGGIQHRDIKPQNLLLVGGSVKVADFGLAKVMAQTMASHTGSMTLPYAAPEFFSGQTASTSDQYSLGVTYCHLRGGRLPFQGSATEIMAGHLMQEPDLTMLPEQERSVVARALAKQPQERWHNCKAFLRALIDGHADQHAPTISPLHQPLAAPKTTAAVFPALEVVLTPEPGAAAEALMLRNKKRCLLGMAIVMLVSLIACGVANRMIVPARLPSVKNTP
jgi:serine/threonine-protein kinase